MLFLVGIGKKKPFVDFFDLGEPLYTFRFIKFQARKHTL